MYSVYLKSPREENTSLLIYDDLNDQEGFLLIEPHLTKEDNAAGSLEFEVPLDSIAYPLITPFDKGMDIYVYKQGYKNDFGEEGTDDVYWAGRVVDVSRGIDNHKVVYCEGVLAFLMDSIQTAYVYKNDEPVDGEEVEEEVSEVSDEDEQGFLAGYVEFLLNRHNQQVEDNRKIYPGLITVTYPTSKWATNFESTMDIFEDIASSSGGHLRIRRSLRNGESVWVLDILNDDVFDPNTMSSSDKWKYLWIPNEDQEIEYGVNLTDLNQSQSLSSVITVVYPLGKRKEESTIEGLDEYITIEGADTSQLPETVTYEVDNDGYPYLRSSFSDVVGNIAVSVNYDDVEDPTELMFLGILSLTLPDSISYEVEAAVIDASYRDRSLKPIDLYDIINVIAAPHNLSAAMKVSKSEISLDNPIDTTFTIGTIKVTTFTDQMSRRTKHLSSEIKYLTVKPYFDPNVPTDQDDTEEPVESEE